MKYAKKPRRHPRGQIYCKFRYKNQFVEVEGFGEAVRGPVCKIKEICFSGLARAFTIGFRELDYAAISYISGLPFPVIKQFVSHDTVIKAFLHFM